MNWSDPDQVVYEWMRLSASLGTTKAQSLAVTQGHIWAAKCSSPRCPCIHHIPIHHPLTGAAMEVCRRCRRPWASEAALNPKHRRRSHEYTGRPVASMERGYIELTTCECLLRRVPAKDMVRYVLYLQGRRGGYYGASAHCNELRKSIWTDLKIGLEPQTPDSIRGAVRRAREVVGLLLRAGELEDQLGRPIPSMPREEEQRDAA